jgi:hypothetical protein
MKNKTLKGWKKDADKYFSQVVRLRSADKRGYVPCYTCSKVLHWKKIQCGHYISRNKLATRFDFDNCRPQCMACNIFKKGNYPDFASRLVGQMGLTILADLVDRSNKTVKYSFCDYAEMIDAWKDELITLEKKGGS